MKRDPANELNVKQTVIALGWVVILLLGINFLENRITTWVALLLGITWGLSLSFLMRKFRTKDRVNQ